MKIGAVVILFTLFVCPLAAQEDWKIKVDNELARGCFLNAYDQLTWKQDFEARERFLAFIKHKLMQVDTPYVERVYFQSVLAWNDQNYRLARNFWIKFVEVARRLPNQKNSPRWQEVQTHWDLAQSYLLKESPKTVVQVQPSPSFSQPAKKKSLSSKAMIEVRTIPKALLKKAETAESSGQIEYAERLYETALRIDPNSAEVKEKLKRVRKLME